MIAEELACSGIGMVYKSRDPVIDRAVGIKLILKRAVSVPTVRQRFYRKARSAGRLTHDSITIICYVGEEDERFYLIMEYLQGQELREALETLYRFLYSTSLIFHNGLQSSFLPTAGFFVRRTILPGRTFPASSVQKTD